MSGNERIAEVVKKPHTAQIRLADATNERGAEPARVPALQRHRFAAISPAPPVVQRTVEKIHGMEYLVTPPAPIEPFLNHWKGKRYGALWKLRDYGGLPLSAWEKINSVGDSLVQAVQTARRYVATNNLPEAFQDVPHYREYQRVLIPGQPGSKHMMAGYVIEEIADRLVDELELDYQDTGAVDHSRPDFTYQVAAGRKALFDVTSARQKGHILGKANWLTPANNVFVMEALYPSLDLGGTRPRLTQAQQSRMMKLRLRREREKYLESDEAEYRPPGKRAKPDDLGPAPGELPGEDFGGAMEIDDSDEMDDG